MSRRFGRNQKRAARERIANLDEALSMTSALLARVVDQRNRLRGELNDVIEALGPDFIGLSAREAVMRAAPEDEEWQVPVGDGQMTVYAMQVRCYDHSLAAKHQLHFRVRLAGQETGYAMSAAAVWHTPAAFLARRMADRIATELVKELRARGAPR